MRAKKKYAVLLKMEPWDGLICSLDVAVTFNYKRQSSAAKILLELYRGGYLKRREVPKNMSAFGKKPTGGHKYYYTLTEKGKKKLKWIKAQGYYL